MIKFEATIDNEKVYLSLNVDDAEQPTAHQITGIATAQRTFRKALYTSFDMYGHTIGASSAAIDVYQALMHTPDNRFMTPRVVQGMRYIGRWKALPLPVGAVK